MFPTAESLAWAPSAIYALGALWALAMPSTGWRAVVAVTRLALAAAVAWGTAALVLGRTPPLYPAAGAAPIVSLLIAFLGWVIGDYSRRYLDGESGQPRFVISFLSTLAAVSAVVASANLGVLIGAWTASSIGLHHLLTFYPARRAAVIVAHKKFLASRLAEVLLIIAAALLYRTWGSLDIAAITGHVPPAGSLPNEADAAAVLIAAAALLKCAQLPLHGWLIQVMEAPTPVSALLHAGVVNLGGYVLIGLAPLISASIAAQTLLVVIGSLTAAIAGLVMLTRITIKVRLAWSTCSQMGFMVMECGLGLYDLALLHLVAHSLYKAHAFLTSGEAVRDGLTRRLVADAVADARTPTLLGALSALLAAAIVATASSTLWQIALGLPPVPWVVNGLLACGLATLLWSPEAGMRTRWAGLLSVVAGAQIYFGWHWLVAVPIGIPTSSPQAVLALWSMLVFGGLYVTQAFVWIRGSAPGAGAFYEWIYAGLYLDERFTRLTFWLWPARAEPNSTESPARAPLEKPEGVA